jgi:hypothetical protein
MIFGAWRRGIVEDAGQVKELVVLTIILKRKLGGSECIGEK